MADKRGQQAQSYTPPPMGRGGGPGRFGPGEKPRNMKTTLLRLWAYFAKERSALLLVFALVLGSAAVTLFVPKLIGWAVDAITAPEGGLLLRTIFMLIIAYASDAMCQFGQLFLMAGISQRTVKALRSGLFDHFQKLPISFFDVRQHGDLMSRLTNDIDNISTTVSSSTSQLMSLIITLVGSLVMMLLLSPIMTVALVVPSILATVLTKTITKKTRPLFKRQQAELGAMSAQLEESISGLLVVHAFNHEASAIREFDDLNQRYFRASLSALIWSGFIMPMMNVITNLTLALIGTLGSELSIRGLISVGTIATFVIYSRQFIRPLNDIANIYNTLQTAVAGAERVFDIFDQPLEAEDAPDAIELLDIKGDVEFKDVSFGYREDVMILHDINLHVEPGQSIALVGETGAGKTTIVNLLARFYELSGGSILIDGLDIRAYSRDSLRRAFGIVLQDTYLFTDTIRENIRYGNPDAKDDMVVEAAEKASAHTFIMRLPDGYDTVLSESGSNLSAGQRQLLAIARAILANSAILILDEATSNVDARTEMRIQSAMLAFMKGRTTFLIAHRLSTIQNADRILVINKGRIAEQGSHAQLLDQKGVYYQMWMSQMNNDLKEELQ